MGSGAFLVEACRQLGARLVEAWRVHPDRRPALPPDETELLHAQRLVAQRCLYGVDKNPKAVDLARLSLWLATLARDHEFTFLDHALKPGDSLVGLTRAQVERMDWARTTRKARSSAISCPTASAPQPPRGPKSALPPTTWLWPNRSGDWRSPSGTWPSCAAPAMP
jgi:hypothetical protein